MLIEYYENDLLVGEAIALLLGLDLPHLRQNAFDLLVHLTREVVDCRKNLIAAKEARDREAYNAISLVHQEAMRELKRAGELRIKLVGEIDKARNGRPTLILIVKDDASGDKHHDFVRISKQSLYEWAKHSEIGVGPAPISPTRKHIPDTTSSTTVDGPHYVRNKNFEVTLFLIAVALARQLERLRYDDPEGYQHFEPFISDKDELNEQSVASYLAQVVLENEVASVPISGEIIEQENSPKKTEVTLFLVARHLAEVLAAAIDSGAFIAWRNEEKQQLEKYPNTDGSYNCAAIERYLTNHVLKGRLLDNQRPTAIQKRLKPAQKNTSAQDLAAITSKEISSCLSSAEREYARAVRSTQKGL